MIRSSRVAVLAALVALAWSASALAQDAGAPGTRLLTYEQVFGAPPGPPRDDAPGEGGILGRLPNITGWLDDATYLETRKDPADGERKLFAVKAADGSAAVYRDWPALTKKLPAGLDARRSAASTPDLARLVFARDNDLYLLDVASAMLRRLTANPGEEHNPAFSPDGTWRGLHARQQPVRLRPDGQRRAPAHRRRQRRRSSTAERRGCTWRRSSVAAAPTRRSGGRPTAPGSRSALRRLAGAGVPASTAPTASTARSSASATRRLAIRTRTCRSASRPSRTARSRGWTSMRRPTTTSPGRTGLRTPDAVVVQWMNRGQDTIRLYACEPATGKKTAAPRGEAGRLGGVLRGPDVPRRRPLHRTVRASTAGTTSTCYGPDGAIAQRLTSGAWRVTGIEAVDEKGGWVYFSGRPTKILGHAARCASSSTAAGCRR